MFKYFAQERLIFSMPDPYRKMVLLGEKGAKSGQVNYQVFSLDGQSQTKQSRKLFLEEGIPQAFHYPFLLLQQEDFSDLANSNPQVIVKNILNDEDMPFPACRYQFSIREGFVVEMAYRSVNYLLVPESQEIIEAKDWKNPQVHWEQKKLEPGTKEYQLTQKNLQTLTGKGPLSDIHYLQENQLLLYAFEAEESGSEEGRKATVVCGVAPEGNSFRLVFSKNLARNLYPLNQMELAIADKHLLLTIDHKRFESHEIDA